MDKRQRIAAQRALVQEALGKLKAATELFGVEDNAVAGDEPGYGEFMIWQNKLAEFERWIWDESPIA